MKISVFILQIVLITQICQAQNETINYFNQPVPGDTPQVFAPGIISLANRRETKIVFSPNGKECLIGIGTEGTFKILYLSCNNGNWTEPSPAYFIANERAQEPFFSPDGQKIFFTSHANIFVSTLLNNLWTTPVELGSPVNTVAEEYHPTVTNDGTLYFCSMRDNPNGYIYRSRYNNGSYTTIEKLDTIINSSKSGTYDPFISPDESFLIFTTIYSEGFGKEDQYISFNVNDTWTKPQNLGALINTDKIEYGSYISPDSKYYFFSRPDGWGPEVPADIYWVKTNFIDLLRKRNDMGN
jgi:hypothetical protein